MKILIIVPSVSRSGGGTAASVINFYSGLSCYSDIICTVATTVTEDEKNEISDDILGNNDFLLFTTKNAGWRYSKELKEYLQKRTKSYDLVWIHALWTSTTFYAAKYAKKYNIPYIVTPHGLIQTEALKRKRFKKRLYWSLIEKRAYDNAIAIHCITEAESLHVKQLTKTKNFVIPNGIEEETFLEKKYNKLDSICFIGSFHEIKALDLLLKSIAQIDDIKLLIAGDGNEAYKRYIYMLVEKLQIGDRVEFKGFADKDVKKEMFRKSAFLVLPSHTEGLSMVGLESVMNSTPVLTTSKCNFDEVEQYNAGMVMENNDPETIKKYILTMFESNIEIMSRNSHKLAIEKFSIDLVSEKMLNQLDKLLVE